MTEPAPSKPIKEIDILWITARYRKVLVVSFREFRTVWVAVWLLWFRILSGTGKFDRCEPAFMAEAETGLVTYRLDPAASKFTVKAFAEGLLSAFGHDPVFGVKDFQGEASFVPGTFENASLKLTINAHALAVVNDVKEKDRNDIESMMRETVLETAKYPEIAFQSNNVSLSRLGEGRYRARVIGDLTLHGVTQKNVWISGEVTTTSDGLRAKGDCSLKQTDYKIRPVSVAGGTLKIKNEVKCSFDICMNSQ